LMKPHVCVFMSEWHAHYSSAFRVVSTEPLAPYLELETVEWDCREIRQPIPGGAALLFQQYPPPVSLLNDTKAHIVWTPMLDHAAWLPLEWWENLPKHVRIVAFSDWVENICRHFDLPVLRLKHYKNPEDYPAADWGGARSMFYWNRRGLFKAGLLEILCNKLGIEDFYFRADVDPNAPKDAAYHLPGQFGKTRVHEIGGFDDTSRYMEILRRSQVYLAPREIEGIGMTFLEAMASGCAVLSFDGRTMNEYIQQGKNGFLLRPAIPRLFGGPRRSLFKRFKNGLRRSAMNLRDPSMLWFHFPFGEWQSYPLDEHTDLSCLEGCDLEQVGQAARQSQVEGFHLWQEALPEYARFISEW
jgi:hypothetical protein